MPPMGSSRYELVGEARAANGPHAFYAGFRVIADGRVVVINECVFARLWPHANPVVAELKLLWTERDDAIASLRLYVLPENTPDGRLDNVHGKDEVLAISERAVMRVEDLIGVMTEAPDWSWGLLPPEWGASIEKAHTSLDQCGIVDLGSIRSPSQQEEKPGSNVMVLSYSKYCRYRALLKRLEGVHEPEVLETAMELGLDFGRPVCSSTRILFCRDTFDCPDLEGHELLSNHVVPSLRTRAPKKKRCIYAFVEVSEPSATNSSASSGASNDDEEDDEDEDDVEDEEEETAVPTTTSPVTAKPQSTPSPPVVPPSVLPASVKPPSCNLPDVVPVVKQETVVENDLEESNGFSIERSLQHCKFKINHSVSKEQLFLTNLYSFMNSRKTPIGDKLPFIGSKELNLYELFIKVKALGGQESVTRNRLWKYVFEEMGGDPANPSAVSIARKFYDRFLSSYEEHTSIKSEASGDTTTTETSQQPQSQISDHVKQEPLTVERVNGSSGAEALSEITLVPIQRMLEMNATRVVDLAAAIRPSPAADVPRRKHTSHSDTPRKRKLDILREGGLEVTAIGAEGSRRVPPDAVTIVPVRGPPPPLTRVTYAPTADVQVLDLTCKKSVTAAAADPIRRYTSNLGPNIEISLVPSGSSSTERKRKSAPPPLPPLRKINAGVIAAAAAAARSTPAPPCTKLPRNCPRPSVTITPTSPPTIVPNDTATAIANSLYLAAVYKTIAAASFVNTQMPPPAAAMPMHASQLALLKEVYQKQHQMRYLPPVMMNPPTSGNGRKTNTTSQKFSNIMKNEMLSLYPNGLPD